MKITDKMRDENGKVPKVHKIIDRGTFKCGAPWWPCRGRSDNRGKTNLCRNCWPAAIRAQAKGKTK